MQEPKFTVNRRQFLQRLAALGVLATSLPRSAAATGGVLQKPIPSSGEMVPVIGMGSSRTFDAGADAGVRERLHQVLQAFFDHGGSVIDTSPMYGNAEQVLGELLRQVDRKRLFTATKVWTQGRQSGIEQMEASMRLLGVPVIDLMQIHNLLDWQVHMETLLEWKAQGKIRYIGITTHRGYDHDEIVHVMQNYPVDFVQFSYSIANRKAEQTILPVAAERGIATMVNRPFQRGELFARVKGQQLPDWTADFDCDSWGQFLLKFVVSHPHVTCTIPATSKAKHMVDNMGAGVGRLPDADQRRRMLAYFETL